MAQPLSSTNGAAEFVIHRQFIKNGDKREMAESGKHFRNKLKLSLENEDIMEDTNDEKKTGDGVKMTPNGKRRTCVLKRSKALSPNSVSQLMAGEAEIQKYDNKIKEGAELKIKSEENIRLYRQNTTRPIGDRA